MGARERFYEDVLNRRLDDKDASVLVCGGGYLDRDVLLQCGFKNVVISNLDERHDASEFAPYKWEQQDMQSLSYEEGSFDYVISHASLHHASSPHRVLTEMYRVASRGVLMIDSRDSWSVRILAAVGATATYEQSAVYYNDCQYGGVNNTCIPNFVYRWTEREVEKTICTYAPAVKHRFTFDYGSAFPATADLQEKRLALRTLLYLVRPFFLLTVKLFPRLQNLFSVYIPKPDKAVDHHEWLNYQDGRLSFSKSWGDRKYKKVEVPRK